VEVYYPEQGTSEHKGIQKVFLIISTQWGRDLLHQNINISG